MQHFCPHARLGFSFAILKARYSFRLYIHINIPENKTKMVFMYWFIWFYTSLYILKMMQIVCIIASEARWWCRWGGVQGEGVVGHQQREDDNQEEEKWSFGCLWSTAWSWEGWKCKSDHSSSPIFCPILSSSTIFRSTILLFTQAFLCIPYFISKNL